jgi:hypothetical protein
MLHQYADPVTDAVRQESAGLAERMMDVGAVGFGEISVLHLSLVPNHSFTEVSPEHPLMRTLVEIAGRRHAAAAGLRRGSTSHCPTQHVSWNGSVLRLVPRKGWAYPQIPKPEVAGCRR